MKTAKIFILPVLLFVFAIFLIVKSLLSMDISAVPLITTVEKAEQMDVSGYNYFKLTDGRALGFASIYEIEMPGNKVKEITYPYVSAAYLQKAQEAYSAAHDGVFDEDDFMEWFVTYKDKPKFYVRTNAAGDSISNETMLLTMLVADTLPKKMEGTRINSMMSLGSVVGDEYEKDGVTLKNAVFIDEGITPEKEKAAAQTVIVTGGILIFIALLLAFIGTRKLKKQRNQEMLMATFKHKSNV